MSRKIYFISGIIAVILGVIGIFLPLLPTTPFILLAAFLFEKSSPKFHKMLVKNRYLGKYITNYHEKKGITLKDKVISIIFLTLGIGKGFVKTDSQVMKIIFIAIYLGVTFHILKLKTLEQEKNIDQKN